MTLKAPQLLDSCGCNAFTQPS